jgi:hypothetical protein
MAQPILGSAEQILDEGIGHALRQGLQCGTITDAMVAASSTNALLQTAVAGVANAAATPDAQQYIQMVNRALTLGFNDGSCSNTNVNASSTVAALVSNTYSQAGKIGIVGEFV